MWHQTHTLVADQSKRFHGQSLEKQQQQFQKHFYNEKVLSWTGSSLKIVLLEIHKKCQALQKLFSK